MITLDDMPLAYRLVLVVAIVLFTLLLMLLLPDASAQTRAAPSKWDARLRQLDKEAVEKAYQNQIVHLFEIWMRDDSRQPERAIGGAVRARNAYIGAMEAIERREPQQ